MKPGTDRTTHMLAALAIDRFRRKHGRLPRSSSLAAVAKVDGSTARRWLADYRKATSPQGARQ